MNTKRLALLGGATVVIAGGLIYSLGIYPPASARNGQGAIGERQVYRAEQPKDASVTPGTAPVAMQATAEQVKEGRVFQLKNGQLMRLSDGGFAILLKSGGLYRLNSALISQVKADALYSQLSDGQMMQVSANEIAFQLQGVQFAAQLRYGMYLGLQGGMFAALRNNAFAEVNGRLMELSADNLQNNLERW